MQNTPCTPEPTQMKKSKHLKIIALFILVTTTQTSIATENVKTKTTYCLRCHSMETLAYRDTTTDQIINLYINPQQYHQSNHKRLECTTCHTTDYKHYPHPDSVKSENLYCLDCHKDDPKLTSYRFPEIEQAFKNSSHAKQLTCFSCHDPHQFKISRLGENISSIVRHHNQICLNCHTQPTNKLLIKHQWLPNPLLHWRSVRCIECHTTEQIHNIQPAAKNLSMCVQCHSKKAPLLTRLYKYRSQEDIQKTGWINKAIFNEAYIIGMSRNETIDRWSLIILILTIAGLFAHGLGRFFATKARRSHKK
jgi:hypothetical protein